MAPNRGPDLNILLLPFHEGIAKISHEQHNQILTNAHYTTLQLDVAAVYVSNFFLFWDQLTVENSFIWIAELQRQIDAFKRLQFKNGTLQLQNAFAQLFLSNICHFLVLLFDFVQSIRLKKINALFNNPIKSYWMNCSRDVFEAV